MSTLTKQVNGTYLIFTWRPVSLIGAVLLVCLMVSVSAGAAAGVLDGNEDFNLLATRGFAQAVDGPHADGSPLNSFAWSMEWFNGALLVGTLKAEGSLQQMRGQIWRYTPGGTGGIAGSWKMVYQSPTSFYGPKDLGYRWMTVCNVGGTPRLYVTTMGSKQDASFIRTMGSLSSRLRRPGSREETSATDPLSASMTRGVRHSLSRPPWA
jgi:hypothetical protein